MNKSTDLTGQKFGLLTVIEYAGKYNKHTSLWLCKCDCGVEKIILGSNLTAKHHSTKSCGCSHYKKQIDITGEKYNSWTIIKMIGIRNGKSWCLCKCDCGKEKEVVARNILSGASKSCGCRGRLKTIERNKQRINKATELSVLKQVIAGYKKDASDRGYAFELSEKECLELFDRKCYYCNSDAYNKRHYHKDKSITAKYMGIDRIDNTKGYIAGNVVSCCKKCNRAKDTMSEQEFLELVNRIYAFSIKGK
jgi:hypothetical protein